jgi:hypothetical protein
MERFGGCLEALDEKNGVREYDFEALRRHFLRQKARYNVLWMFDLVLNNSLS